LTRFAIHAIILNLSIQRTPDFMSKHLRTAMVLASILLVKLSYAQQKVDEKYINEQIGKVNEYTLLTYGLGKPTAPQDSIDKWKMGHLKLLFQLQADGKISHFGPVAKDPSNVGIAIFNTNDENLVKQYIEKDPFVRNNVLTYKLSKWYAVPDTKLLPSSTGNK
jgi:uncharacterized protein YciI